MDEAHDACGAPDVDRALEKRRQRRPKDAWQLQLAGARALNDADRAHLERERQRLAKERIEGSGASEQLLRFQAEAAEKAKRAKMEEQAR